MLYHFSCKIHRSDISIILENCIFGILMQLEKNNILSICKSSKLPNTRHSSTMYLINETVK